MRGAHSTVILGQVGLDLPGCLKLVIHTLDGAAVRGIGEAFLQDPERHFERREDSIERQIDLGRCDGSLIDRALQHHAECHRRAGDQLGDETLRHGIEPRRRIDDATREVVVRDQALVVPVGDDRAVTDECLEPVVGVLDLHDRRRQCRRELPQRVIGAIDAPLYGAVDVVLRLGLAGVKGMERIRQVVAQHTRGIDGRRPVLLLQRRDDMAIPVAHLRRRAAPEVLARMQDVVLEVLEAVIGRLGAEHEQLGVLQKDAAPCLGVIPRQMAQAVECELVVRAPCMGGIEHAKEHIHQRLRLSPLQLGAR